MSSLGDVAAQVSQACDKASKCRDALGIGQDLAEDAQAILATALEGSGDSDAEGAVADFGEVVKGVVDLWKILGSGMDHAQAVLDAVTGGSPPPPAPVAPRAAQPPQQRPSNRPTESDDPHVIPPERIEHYGANCHHPWCSTPGRRRTAGG